ncbi:unnamed protein product [Microthlaspi erraticum]|uniref:CCHC-type domain-containing protein n=1 Tax=Microthlaspi erraticum TaxID=1685480 RepID=A0A6D2KR20_9BRAS|nr:unnamed protein product [Microthlaspi erraticum]
MTSSAETVDSTQNILNVNMSNVTKLNSSNYLMWSLQVHALLDGYDLAGYLDGSTPTPAATLTTNEVVSTNPAYTKWNRQDKLIFSGILGAISQTIQPMFSKSKTSAEIWTTLTSIYAKPSRGHVKQLKQQIKQFSKGDKTIDAYIHGLTTRFDQLALLGKPIEHEDQIEFILEGLPDDYKPVVEQIEGRDLAPSIVEVHEKLLTREAKLLAASSSLAVTPISANMANTRPKQFHGKQPQQQRSAPTWQNTSNSNYQRQDGQAPRGYQGRCQLCGVQGHSAKRCPQLPNQPPLIPRGMMNQSYRPWQPRANLAIGSSSPADT